MKAFKTLPLIALVTAGQASFTTPATAQGSAADYERADGLGARSRGLVVGERAEITWSPNGSGLSMVKAEPGVGSRLVVLDLTSDAPLEEVDSPAIAKLCVASGFEVEPRDLPIVGIEYQESGALGVLLSSQDEFRIVLLDGGSPQLIDPTRAELFVLKPRRRGRTRRGSGTSLILFNNPTERPAKIEWIDNGGKRNSRGSVAAGESAARPTYAGHVWELLSEDGESLAFYQAGKEASIANVPDTPVEIKRRHPSTLEREAKEDETAAKPPGRLRFAEGSVLWIDNLDESRTELTIPDDLGDASLFGPVLFSPDGKHAVLHALTEGSGREVHIIESSPSSELQPILHSFDYAKPGDQLRQRKPVLFDVASRRLILLDDTQFPEPWRIDQIAWAADSAHFYFRYNQRGHQVMRWLRVEAANGKVQTIFEDANETFIDYSQKGFVQHLIERGEVLWMSERSGRNHLLRFDANTGEVLNSVTSGDWTLRAVERVDVEQEEVWFRAMGVYPDQDPYHVHLGRVKLDGSELTWLTEGDGTHELSYSPDGEHYVDSWSRVDQAPIHQLRRTEDGELVSELGRADDGALLESGWRTPERFAAPGRDGETAIWGVIFTPTTFDAETKYPVIEQIYAGPHDAFVPKRFRSYHGPQALAELGFVVVQIDGMGTNWRTKAFHDVAWKNLKDAGFPDRIAWMCAAAETRPWMDLSRVGIYGGSAGGQSALRAVLDHHDFYRAAAADCGCHDNRMDKVWWNEAWMGWPIDESYAANSNVVDAHKLGAPLLLTVGELDRNVDPASTMQVVKALIDADKDFELIVFPGGGHGSGGGRYGKRRMRDFFVRELHGIEPRWGPVSGQ